MRIFVFLITIFSWIKILSSVPLWLSTHPPPPPQAMITNRCPSWTSTPCPFFLSSLKSRDSMKTCSYCHFTNNFFNFNYSRISTGEYFLSHSSCFYLHLLAYFLYVHISFRPIAALSWYVPPWLSTILPISTLALTKMLQKHLGAYWWKYGMLLSHLNYMTPSRPFSDLLFTFIDTDN